MRGFNAFTVAKKRPAERALGFDRARTPVAPLASLLGEEDNFAGDTGVFD
jgi:hypothetical protein